MLSVKNQRLQIIENLDFFILKSVVYNTLGGDKESVSSRLEKSVATAIERIKNAAAFRGIWQHVPILHKEDAVYLGGGGFPVKSRKFSRVLSRFSTAVVCAGTLGKGVDKLLNDPGLNAADRYVLDTVASLAMERCMDTFQARIRDESGMGNSITHRYSPGYCDWHVSQQKHLFRALPAGLIGINLSDSFLMSPRKSVSAVMAVGSREKVVKYGNACNTCGNTRCRFRRNSALSPAYIAACMKTQRRKHLHETEKSPV